MARLPKMGRRRVEIKRITCESARRVTFTKRRSGLFKKASELCILCGAEAAILVFSCVGKVFSFGHPDAEKIVDTFLAQINLPPGAAALPLLSTRHGGALANVHGLDQGYSEVLNQLETERKRAKEIYLSNPEAEKGDQPWWELPIEDMGVDQLQKFQIALEGLKESITKRVDEHVATATSISSPSISSIKPYDDGYGYSFGPGLK